MALLLNLIPIWTDITYHVLSYIGNRLNTSTYRHYKLFWFFYKRTDFVNKLSKQFTYVILARKLFSNFGNNFTDTCQIPHFQTDIPMVNMLLYFKINNIFYLASCIFTFLINNVIVNSPLFYYYYRIQCKKFTSLIHEAGSGYAKWRNSPVRDETEDRIDVCNEVRISKISTFLNFGSMDLSIFS